MKLEAPKNPNYAATIVRLSTFIDLPNCDNVKGALLFNNQVIVSKDAQVGDLGIYFPVEAQISAEFLGANNQFRKYEFGNNDPAAKAGFFEQHGRVKAVKFRGHKSEGFWCPLSFLLYLGTTVIWDDPLHEGHYFLTGGLREDVAFDFIGDHEICRKYVPKHNPAPLSKNRLKQPRAEDQILPDQFRFHPDTENLRRNAHKLHPTDYISITDKIHGTSVVIGNLLTRKPLSFLERLVRWAGVEVSESVYSLVWSSRRVVKGVGDTAKANSVHYYDEDIWGIVAKEVKDDLEQGITVYGEITGYMPGGGEIQKSYTYGAEPGKHDFWIYRVTWTNPAGFVFEFSRTQIVEYCTKHGFKTVPDLQAPGIATALVAYDGKDLEAWQIQLLKTIEAFYVTGRKCSYNPGMPAEGVVVKIDHYYDPVAFKVKSFEFLELESKMLDAGAADIESSEEPAAS